MSAGAPKSFGGLSSQAIRKLPKESDATRGSFTLSVVAWRTWNWAATGSPSSSKRRASSRCSPTNPSAQTTTKSPAAFMATSGLKELPVAVKLLTLNAGVIGSPDALNNRAKGYWSLSDVSPSQATTNREADIAIPVANWLNSVNVLTGNGSPSAAPLWSNRRAKMSSFVGVSTVQATTKFPDGSEAMSGMDKSACAFVTTVKFSPTGVPSFSKRWPRICSPSSFHTMTYRPDASRAIVEFPRPGVVSAFMRNGSPCGEVMDEKVRARTSVGPSSYQHTTNSPS